MAAKKRRKKAPFQVKGSPAAKKHMAKARKALKTLISKGRNCKTTKKGAKKGAKRRAFHHSDRKAGGR